MAVPTDAELWGRACAGDADAFGDLFERHARAIYNFAFRRTADWTLAEDLTATVFLEAWRRRAEVRLDGESALPWLFGVAANVLRNQRRSARRRTSAFARLAGAGDASDFADDVAGRLDDEREMARILELVERLPAEEQDVLAGGAGPPAGTAPRDEGAARARAGVAPPRKAVDRARPCGRRAATLALLLVAPWDSRGPSVVDRALAAVGAGPVVHAVVEYSWRQDVVVDLATGAERERVHRVAYWYDGERGQLRTRSATDDAEPADAVISARAAQLDRALAGFATQYRDALANGGARDVGDTTVDGRSAKRIEFARRSAGAVEEVTVDAQTHMPLRFHTTYPGGRRSPEWRPSAPRLSGSDRRSGTTRSTRSSSPARGRG